MPVPVLPVVDVPVVPVVEVPVVPVVDVPVVLVPVVPVPVVPVVPVLDGASWTYHDPLTWVVTRSGVFELEKTLLIADWKSESEPGRPALAFELLKQDVEVVELLFASEQSFVATIATMAWSPSVKVLPIETPECCGALTLPSVELQAAASSGAT